MRARNLLFILFAVSQGAGCGTAPATTPDAGDGGEGALPPWLSDSRILVPGVGVTNTECRAGICQHNENTDLVRYKGAIYFVHRTAQSQVLGPNSALHVYRSDDDGK